MKAKFTLILLILGLNTPVWATVWRVNNLPGTDADFTTIQLAHNSSSVLPGDTLHIEASSGSYGNLTATKRLTIIGNGYFLAENLNHQANINMSIIDLIKFNAGSDGSTLIGCYTSKIEISASNLLLERNYINPYHGHGASSIQFFGSTTNTIIRNNYIVPKSIGSYDHYTIRCESGIANNVLITGNYIWMISSGHAAIKVTGSFSGEISNNVIDGGYVQIHNTLFINNIMTTSTFYPTNSTVTNNICNSTQIDTANGNQQNVTMTNVFVGPTGNSTDGQWQLKTGSPAIGAGVGGVDCGMFGGTFPYVLSGIPAIPAIYFHDQTLDNVNQELNITIKAKSNN